MYNGISNGGIMYLLLYEGAEHEKFPASHLATIMQLEEESLQGQTSPRVSNSFLTVG